MLLTFRRYSERGEGSRVFRLNVAECRPRAVSGMAASAAIEVIGPELFKPCSKFNIRPRLPTAREGSAPSRPLTVGEMAFWAAAEPAGPMADLPPPDVKRWTIRRKAAVVTAVAEGVLTREEACRRYQLSEEEFDSWQRAFEAHGLPGLRSTRLQQYRGSPSRRGTKPEDC